MIDLTHQQKFSGRIEPEFKRQSSRHKNRSRGQPEQKAISPFTSNLRHNTTATTTIPFTPRDVPRRDQFATLWSHQSKALHSSRNHKDQKSTRSSTKTAKNTSKAGPATSRQAASIYKLTNEVQTAQSVQEMYFSHRGGITAQLTSLKR